MVIIVTRRHVGWSGNRITGGAKMSNPGSGTNPASYVMVYGGPCHQVVNLTTYFHLVPR